MCSQDGVETDVDLLSRLMTLQDYFQQKEGLDLAYVHLDTQSRSTCLEWQLSLVTKCFWKRSSDDWIDEVVLSVEVMADTLCADVSFGTGQILSDIRGHFSSLAVRQWFDDVDSVIEAALLKIQEHAELEQGKIDNGTSKN